MSDPAAVVAACASGGTLLLAGYNVREGRRSSRTAWRRERLPEPMAQSQRSVKDLQRAVSLSQRDDMIDAMDRLIEAHRGIKNFGSADMGHVADTLLGEALRAALLVQADDGPRLAASASLADVLATLDAAYAKDVT